MCGTQECRHLDETRKQRPLRRVTPGSRRALVAERHPTCHLWSAASLFRWKGSVCALQTPGLPPANFFEMSIISLLPKGQSPEKQLPPQPNSLPAQTRSEGPSWELRHKPGYEGRTRSREKGEQPSRTQAAHLRAATCQPTFPPPAP